jgi:phosphoribosylaminoimidazolecarboxamide formyltransferase / IMP cyclohydrolase
MKGLKKIKTVLVSVFHKDGLGDLIQLLHSQGAEFVSTGGTAGFLNNLGIQVKDVEKLTGYPEILGGRVKTLHPAIFGGILARAEHEGDQAELSKFSIETFDLVIVDLYPFEQTVMSGATQQEIIEKIDIGGISLIRAAAKNYNDVAILSSMDQYQEVYNLLQDQNGHLTLEQRAELAFEAFGVSSYYDSAICNYFQQKTNSKRQLRITERKSISLRYGENPHQKGWFHGNLSECFEKLGGKEISYNNLLDIDAAINLINDFDEPTCAIIKHNNACGAASGPNIIEAWEAALAGDPVSAFGGVIIFNRPMDVATAQAVNSIFFEVLIAPGFAEGSAEVFKGKANRILLQSKAFKSPGTLVRNTLNGFLEQEPDLIKEDFSNLQTVTNRPLTDREAHDLVFAIKLSKHSKSNTVILVKNKQMIGAGSGLTSRVDALKLAIRRSEEFGFSLSGSVMASDAFFPFPDCVEISAMAGVTAISQPGGSVKDQLSIDKANELGISMALTGFRHFKH